MPILKNFLFCLNTNNTNGTNNVTGILCAISPEYVPGLYSFAVNFSVLDLAEGVHNFSLKFSNSNGELVTSIENATVNYIKDRNSNLPDEYLGVNVAANFQNVDIKISGLYSMDVILDGQSLQKVSVFVKGKNEK